MNTFVVNVQNALQRPSCIINLSKTETLKLVDWSDPVANWSMSPVALLTPR